jgi:hypothetical protein
MSDVVLTKIPDVAKNPLRMQVRKDEYASQNESGATTFVTAPLAVELPLVVCCEK